MGQTRVLFVYFRTFHNLMTNIKQNLTLNGKSMDGMLGIRTRDRWMLGADESTDLLQPHLVTRILAIQMSSNFSSRVTR